jgi:hypothetical protein
MVTIFFLDLTERIPLLPGGCFLLQRGHSLLEYTKQSFPSLRSQIYCYTQAAQEPNYSTTANCAQRTHILLCIECIQDHVCLTCLLLAQ